MLVARGVSACDCLRVLVDRTDRQYRQLYRGEARGTSMYADSRTGSRGVRGFETFFLGSRPVEDRSVRAVPGYFWWEARYELDEGALTPPATDVDGWSVTERQPGEATLEPTTPLTVFEAGNRNEADRGRLSGASVSGCGACSHTEFSRHAASLRCGSVYLSRSRTVV
jgi:hypothetical protein